MKIIIKIVNESVLSCRFSSVTISICSYAFFVTQWFVLLVLNIIHVLDLESICLIPYIYIILHNVLVLARSITYLLFLLWIYGTSYKIYYDCMHKGVLRHVTPS